MTQPDAPIAPGVDPDEPAAEPAADRWVRYTGAETQTVIYAGGWEPGETRHVPGWLAQRLLARVDFSEADEPADSEAPADEVTEPVKTSRRRGAAAEPAEPPADEAPTS